MAYIYRYTDLVDGIIKYVGIVWGESRTLQQRLNEHERNDEWCFIRRWKIEYIEVGINNRTEAEFFESHFISLYGTDKYFNTKKSNWGTSNLVPFQEKDWIEIKTNKTMALVLQEENEQLKQIQTKKIMLNKIANELSNEIKIMKNEINKNKKLYNSNGVLVNVSDIISLIDDKIALYREWSDESCTKSKSSRDKWYYRLGGLLTAKSIIEDTMPT